MIYLFLLPYILFSNFPKFEKFKLQLPIQNKWYARVTVRLETIVKNTRIPKLEPSLQKLLTPAPDRNPYLILSRYQNRYQYRFILSCTLLQRSPTSTGQSLEEHWSIIVLKINYTNVGWSRSYLNHTFILYIQSKVFTLISRYMILMHRKKNTIFRRRNDKRRSKLVYNQLKINYKQKFKKKNLNRY